MITVRRGTYIGRRRPKPATPQERKKKKKQITHAKKQQKGRRSDYTLFLNTDCCLRACVRFRKRQPQQGQCGRANKKKGKYEEGCGTGQGHLDSGWERGCIRLESVPYTLTQGLHSAKKRGNQVRGVYNRL